VARGRGEHRGHCGPLGAVARTERLGSVCVFFGPVSVFAFCVGRAGGEREEKDEPPLNTGGDSAAWPPHTLRATGSEISGGPAVTVGRPPSSSPRRTSLFRSPLLSLSSCCPPSSPRPPLSPASLCLFAGLRGLGNVFCGRTPLAVALPQRSHAEHTGAQDVNTLKTAGLDEEMNNTRNARRSSSTGFHCQIFASPRRHRAQ